MSVAGFGKVTSVLHFELVVRLTRTCAGIKMDAVTMRAGDFLPGAKSERNRIVGMLPVCAVVDIAISAPLGEIQSEE